MIELSAEEQRRVEELFERALGVQPEERAAVLAEFEGPLAVRKEVESLLQFQPSARSRLDTPLVEANAVLDGVEKLLIEEHSRSDRDPETVGPYAILRKLGEGGMGSVYLAEQSEPLKRQVAVKVIKLGMDTKAVVARFDAERAALAMMNHPHVARAFDAGATPDGRPYFVMEFVDGVRITDHCDDRKSDIGARLELFVGVCEAIQHAHQKGVIHRDIKPSNVLVCQENGRSFPKVIDFGVAKATHQRSTDQTVTGDGVIIGTPSYMSPEQADPESPDVDTRSDIYSLGVLLYELLVGALPTTNRTGKKSSTNGLVEIARDTEPTKPSTRLSDPQVGSTDTAIKRGMDLATLRRTLRGDLDWIVMKCLARERDRRYSSAAELIADVQRYLQHQPIEAGPPSAFYRARKYVRRNRALVVASIMVFVSLITATTASTIMYIDANAARNKADQERKTAEEISKFVQGMLTSVDPRIARGRDVTVLREVLDTAAKRLETHEVTDPQIVSSLRRTIGNAYHSIGQESNAERQFRAALELQKGILPANPLERARAQTSLGNYLRQMSRFEEAEPLLRDSLDIRKRELGEGSLLAAQSMFDLAILCEQTGSKEAEPLYRRALAIHRGKSNERSDAFSSTLHAFAIHLRNRNRLQEAEEPFREALAIRQKIHGEDHPSVVPMELGIGIWLRSVKKYKRSEEHMLAALRICRANFPQDHPETLTATSNLAALYQDMRRFDDAERMHRETLAIQRKLYKSKHIDVGTSANNLASLLSTQDRMEEAKPLYREAAEVYRDLLGADHYWVSIPLVTLAYIYESEGDIDTAQQLVKECLRIRRLHSDPSGWQIAEVETVQGACLLARGDYEEAESTLLKSLTRLQTRYGRSDRVIKYTRKRLGDLYDAWKKPDEAAKWK